jgi:DNA anti-recombination protein RmuC
MTTTEQQTTQRNTKEMGDVDERLRQAILDKRQAQIRELTATIDQLQRQADQVAEGVRSETGRRLDDLRAARESAMARLEELKRSIQETQAGLLVQNNEAFQSISDSFHAFVNSQT